MIRYHDEEWGKPVHDDRRHFEFLVLEGAQAGLSWATILRKREAYRTALAGFDTAVLATWGSAEVERLLQNAEIVRNRLKLESVPINARAFVAVQREFGSFDRYVWSFVDGKPLVNTWKAMSQVPASTPLSDRLSKDLKRRGFKFVGTTILYSYLQATGLINDHLTTCPFRGV